MHIFARKEGFLAGFLAILLSMSAIDMVTPAQADEHENREAYTAILARPLSQPALPVLGSDQKIHIAYELVLENASRRVGATIIRIEALSGGENGAVLGALWGDTLQDNLFGLGAQPADDLDIGPGEGRLLAMNLELDSTVVAPTTIIHRITALAAVNPGSRTPVETRTFVAQLPVSAPQQLVLGTPLKGKGWVAINGCCETGFPHRMSILPINGALVNAQRFAIDWMQLGDDGALVRGKTDIAANWQGYGSKVYAVADATVVHVINDLDDQVPGSLPDPQTLTLKTIDGNSIILDLGNGYYVFYAHLQKGSVSVKPGDRVARGDQLGLLGNSGNTSAPHLHIHVMTGPSALGADGQPYLLDHFTFVGQVSRQSFEDSEELTDDFAADLTGKPRQIQDAYPMQLNVVDFPD